MAKTMKELINAQFGTKSLMDLRSGRGFGTKALNKGREREREESAVWNLLLQLHLLTALNEAAFIENYEN